MQNRGMGLGAQGLGCGERPVSHCSGRDGPGVLLQEGGEDSPRGHSGESVRSWVGGRAGWVQVSPEEGV